MKSIKLELKWAVIFIVMMLSWMLMERVLGFHDERIELHPVITNFVAIPAILVYILALRDKRKRHYPNKMTYWNGFKTGLIITAIVTVFSPLMQYITSAVISPDYFENVIAYSTANDLMPEEDARAYFNMESYIVQTVMFTPIMGVFTSALVALFFIRKN